ncbi:lipopolysaccharide kinase InaA family protein [Azorhizophilus paspali]|uniref:Lipopolysaccharide kinase InaA family protein n=1 Tax=Azorhizophilus paspali TaxID=69963 RepID=A0ABV6SJN6_AZOPA
MNLCQLRKAGRQPELPLLVELADAAGPADLRLDSLLRVLPGQRYVGRGEWRGQRVLAKLLVGDKASRHFQRELKGVHLLAAQQQATPRLLAEGLVEGEGGWLLFEYLEEAQGLNEAWQRVEDEPLLSDAQQAVLGEALAAIAGLHAGGLWQADMHLDNLLRHAGRLYVVDGAAVQAQTPGRPLSRERVLENLGAFFAQFPAELEPFIEELLVHYLLVNGEHALPLEALLKEVARVRRWRLRDFLAKLGRDCTLFSVQRGPMGLRAVRRDSEALLRPLLAAPDALIERGHIYKTGGAATVARIESCGRTLVVKRYNIKGLAHWLKRFWRPSRGWRSWVAGNRLAFLGIPTPRPLAVLERRFCGLRGRAYLIVEYCGGQDILARFRPYLDGAPPEEELLALERLFAALLRERISHGDLKGNNLLWQDGRWLLIDLDALEQHQGGARFARAFAEDRARFLRNWPTDSALHRLLDQRLPRAADARTTEE